MKRKKDKNKNCGKVIIPVGHPSPPEQHEIDVAFILARHYQCDVEFLIPVDDYLRTSPDILMRGVEWEIKCPKGKSRYTIQEQFKRASRQAKSIIIDSRRTKLKYDGIEKQVIFEAERRKSINRIILINKSGKVVEIKM
jgi:predicted phage-related endonuclease